jgi:hypothetical protein
MNIRALIVAAAIVGAANSVEAQGITFHIAGGAAFPVGSFGDAAGTSWHGLAGIGLASLMQPISLRADIAHYRFDSRITSATLNLNYRLPLTDSPLSPYVSAGAGAYRLECEPDCGDDTRFGWNAGLGTKIAALRMKWFLESRFQAITAESRNVRFVPLTLGLTF